MPKLRKLGIRGRARIGLGSRAVKMVRPECSDCQTNDAQSDWWKSCPHEPYVTRHETTVRQPVVEDREDGKRVVTGYEETIEFEERPNLTQVQRGNPRVSSDAALPYHVQVHGYKTPEEMGLAPFCEYVNCWYQDDLKAYSTGTFCRELEAKMVAVDLRRGVKSLEVLLDEKRQEQIEGIKV